ncbi:hypothetical protein L1887_24232 [Cichorium endivia]|nr:hypothetical protein L1887_24232 [Cichorium endivia]
MSFIRDLKSSRKLRSRLHLHRAPTVLQLLIISTMIKFQLLARKSAHRIRHTREVKVIYMEAVVDKVSSHEKEDNFRVAGFVDSDGDLVGKDHYIGSIESLIRNNIQQYKKI